MARRGGPIPKPLAIRLLEGTHREDRHGNCIVASGRPTKPRRLSKEASAYWRETMDELEEVGTLAVPDRQFIARYCEELVKRDELAEKVEKFGDVQIYKNPDGSVKYMQVSPWASELHRCIAMLSRMAAELGLTPSGRAGLHVKPKGTPKVSSRNRMGAG